MSILSEVRASVWRPIRGQYLEGSLSVETSVAAAHTEAIVDITNAASDACERAREAAWAEWRTQHRARCSERDGVRDILHSTATLWLKANRTCPKAETDRAKTAQRIIDGLHQLSEDAFRGKAATPEGARDSYGVPGSEDVLKALCSQIDQALPVANSYELTVEDLTELVGNVLEGLASNRPGLPKQSDIEDQFQALLDDLPTTEETTSADAFTRFSGRREKWQKELTKQLRRGRKRESYPIELDKNGGFPSYPQAFRALYPIDSQRYEDAAKNDETLQADKEALRWTDAKEVYDDLKTAVTDALDEQQRLAAEQAETSRTQRRTEIEAQLNALTDQTRAELRTQWAEEAARAGSKLLNDQAEDHAERMKPVAQAVSDAAAAAVNAAAVLENAPAALDARIAEEDEAIAAHEAAEAAFQEATARRDEAGDDADTDSLDAQVDGARETSLDTLSAQTAAGMRTTEAKEVLDDAPRLKQEADKALEDAQQAQTDLQVKLDAEREALEAAVAEATRTERAALEADLDKEAAKALTKARTTLDKTHEDQCNVARKALQDQRTQIEGKEIDKRPEPTNSLTALGAKIKEDICALNKELVAAFKRSVENAATNYSVQVDKLIEHASYVLVICFAVRHQQQMRKSVYWQLTQDLRNNEKQGLSPEHFVTSAERRALQEFLALGGAVRATDEAGKTRYFKAPLLEFLDEQELKALD